MHLTRTQIIILGIALLVIIALALIFIGILPGLRSKEEAQQLSGELLIWGIDDEKVWKNTLIPQYQDIHPNVKLTYRQISEATYEDDLINALAAGTGPDIFMFHNTWLAEHKDKISALTAEQFPITSFRQIFPAVVEQDFILNSQVYALPLHLDTLVLVSNRELLDSAGIANPPQTWEQLINIIPKLREIESATNKITRAAAALGGSNKSVVNAPDLVSALMLQDGVAMTDEDFSAAHFARTGERALTLYVSFANSANTAYTWNDSLSLSFDAFAQEKVAMVFAYGSQIEKIKAKNPFLPIAISAFPQPSNASKAITYPSYWGLAVSKKSQFNAVAWNFIYSAAADSEINKSYLDASEKSPALRSLIDQYQNDPERGIFARQALTAKSWRQIDNVFVSETFSQMIQSILQGQSSIDKALKTAEEKISSLMRRKGNN